MLLLLKRSIISDMQEKKFNLTKAKKINIRFYNQHFPEAVLTLESPNPPSSSLCHSNSDSLLENSGASMTNTDPILTPLSFNDYNINVQDQESATVQYIFNEKVCF